jgi:hypothetical protein
LNLPLIDRAIAAGVGGSHEFDLYLGCIRILDLGYFQWGRFMGVNRKGGGQQHQVLLGRTLLRGMMLVYDGRCGAAELAV